MKKILLVEDDTNLSESYSILLLAEGYDVARAGDGDEALERVQEFEPDLILLDLLMPKRNGIEFLREFSKTKNSEVKIIVFTNLPMHEIEEEAKSLGAQRYLIKSTMSPKELAEVIKEELS